MKRATGMLASAAFLLSLGGGLLLLEVIRPFRDLAIDGPIALGAWTLGAALAGSMFCVRGRSLLLGSLALACNLLPLLAVGGVFLLLRGSNFAWDALDA